MRIVERSAAASTDLPDLVSKLFGIVGKVLKKSDARIKCNHERFVFSALKVE